MRQELILYHKLQRVLWCGKGICPTIHARWEGLRDEIIAHTREPEVARTVEAIMHQQHNLFGYPNEERGLWLEFEGNGMRQYYEKKRSEVVYFVGCKTSFLIPMHHQASAIVKGLKQERVDFALLGNREWCCGIILKRLGLQEEFEACKQHNLEEIRKLGVTQVIFSCHSCYSAWQEEYGTEGVEFVYRGSIS